MGQAISRGTICREASGKIQLSDADFGLLKATVLSMEEGNLVLPELEVGISSLIGATRGIEDGISTSTGLRDVFPLYREHKTVVLLTYRL